MKTLTIIVINILIGYIFLKIAIKINDVVIGWSIGNMSLFVIIILDDFLKRLVKI